MNFTEPYSAFAGRPFEAVFAGGLALYCVIRVWLVSRLPRNIVNLLFFGLIVVEAITLWFITYVVMGYERGDHLPLVIAFHPIFSCAIYSKVSRDWFPPLSLSKFASALMIFWGGLMSIILVALAL